MLLVLSKDNCQETVEVPGGRGDLARREVMAELGKETFLAFSFLVCHDPGNEKKFDPGLVPSLELWNVTFSQSSPRIGWLSILSSG